MSRSSMAFAPHSKKSGIYMNICGGSCVSVQQSVVGKKDPKLEHAIQVAKIAFFDAYENYKPTDAAVKE